MKKTTCILLLLALISLGTVSAQTGLRFGLKAGFSTALQYGISPADDTYTVETGNRNGFAGGVFLYIPITESVGLQQELLYAQKGSKQDVTINGPVSVNTVSDYNLNYFEMPMIIKYRFFKIREFGVYGSTGIALSLLIDGDYSITSTINAGGPPIIVPESGDMKGLDTFDYSFVYGLGTDFKLLKQDFFLDVRMTVGWNTLQMPNSSGADPVPLRNQDYVIALGMYF